MGRRREPRPLHHVVGERSVSDQRASEGPHEPPVCEKFVPRHPFVRSGHGFVSRRP
jgi:hypothetical protein